MKKKHKNIGSNFEDLLEEEGILAECKAEAIKRVLAWQDTKIKSILAAEIMRLEKPVLCNCGGRACICGDGGKWAAHCQDCDNTIGAVGFYDRAQPRKKKRLKCGMNWQEKGYYE